MGISQTTTLFKNKKLFLLIFVSVLFVLLIPIGTQALAHADACDVMRLYGNTAVPVKENHIKMVKEEVKIDGSVDFDNTNNKTQAIFTFENTTDKEIKLEMGFPFTKKYSGLNPKIIGNCFTFTTKIDGKNIPVERIKTASNTQLKIGAEYAFMYIWPIIFKPKEKKIVECVYECSRELTHDPICEREIGLTGSSINYVTKTGALWEGHIGQADFYVNIGNNLSERLKKKNTRIVITPKGYKIVDHKTIEWHFKNWDPTEDIHIEFYWNYKK